MEDPQSNQEQQLQQEDEEDFIDIEVTPLSKEFEFQMPSSSFSSPSHTRQATTADELFHNGKLLPLLLPPRLQMVQNLLEPSRSLTAPPTLSNTPTNQSCNISPAESCRASFELNPDEYLFNWSTQAPSFFINGGKIPHTHFSKRQNLLTQKLKSSKSYLKSLFLRSGSVARAKEYVGRYIRLAKRNPFGEMEKDSSFCTMRSVLDGEMEDHVSFSCHRKSFSGAIKRHCTSKCYSSSSSSSSSCSASGKSCSSTSSGSSSSCSSFSLKNSGGCEGKVLKRSVSADSEEENSIQGAIAHCKRSAGEVRACLVGESEIGRI